MPDRESPRSGTELDTALGAVMCPPGHDGTAGILSDGSRCYVCIARAYRDERNRIADERFEFQLRLTACDQSRETLRQQLEDYTHRNLDLLAQLDGKISASTADEWLMHRFNQVCDEVESLRSELANPAGNK